MKKMRFWKFVTNEQGNVVALVALTFISLLAMVGLAIDGGLLYMTKTHLQKTANAAALSGAQELTNKEERVKLVINDILKAHKEASNLENIYVEMDKQVSVAVGKPVKLAFGKIFGFDEVRVSAKATAGIRPMGRSLGAAPLGIDESVQLEFYKPYQLKVDSTSVNSGNFGVLALGNVGARTYEENLRYGYQTDLKVGMIVDTQTGNIAGKTRDVVQQLVNGCPETVESIYDRKCSRVILIPVYKPYQYDQNQLKSVMITGFAYFYITQPMSSNDTAIKGMFIKRAGKGFEEVGSVNKGAYSIRLTE
jgi:hypothetical protein